MATQTPATPADIDAAAVESSSGDELPRPVVLFDGDCGLCDKSVQFILDHDKRGQFHFTPLQSEYGKRALEAAGLPVDYRSSIVLLDDAGTHTDSTAIARIASRLDGIYKLAGLMRWIPRPLRDWGYRLVARNRFKWFGHADASESCKLLPPEQRSRIVL